MKKPESSKISEKSTKKEEKLEITLIFLTTVFMYNNIGDLMNILYIINILCYNY